MGQPRTEQETTILWDDEERTVRISSADPVTWRRLARLGVPVVSEDRHPATGELRVCFYALALDRLRWGVKAGRRRSAVPAGVPVGRRTATLAEQETIITWRASDAVVTVHTASAVIWRKLARLGFEPIAETHYQGTGELSGRDYAIPRGDFTWGLRRPKRPATAAQVAAAARARVQRQKPAFQTEPRTRTGAETGEARG